MVMNNEEKRYRRTVRSLAIGMFIGGVIAYYNAHRNPYKDIAEDYISPKSVEIKCEDINNDGTLETIMKIDTTSYLFMKKDGKPEILEYKLIPRKDSIAIQ